MLLPYTFTAGERPDPKDSSFTGGSRRSVYSYSPCRLAVPPARSPQICFDRPIVTCPELRPFLSSRYNTDITSSKMEYAKSLKASLEDVIANSTSLLRFLQDSPQSAHPSGCGPADPFAQAPSDVNIARQKLCEGATKLVQLSTSSEEYLDHLANNVSPIRCFEVTP